MRFEIHVSELKTFLRCRRSYEWSSRLGLALEPKRPYRPFYLGRGVHHALQVYYDTGEMPQDAYETWCAAQEKILEAELGFWDDEIVETLRSQRELGAGMLDHYAQWAPEHDKHLDWIGTEMQFKIPIPALSGRPSSRVYLSGRFDGLVQDKRTGLFWLFEIKTSKSKQGNSQDWLRNDLQAGVYVWAAQQLYGRDVAGVLYSFLLKKVPQPPRLLKSGKFSTAQNALAGTTYEVFRAAISAQAAHDLEMPELATLANDPGQHVTHEPATMIFHDYRKERYNEYREQLMELWHRGNPFFWRQEIRRTPFELVELMRQVHHISLEMCRPSTPMYPMPDMFTCMMCQFKEPCYARMAGADYKFHLREMYQRRKLWNETDGTIKEEG